MKQTEITKEIEETPQEEINKGQIVDRKFASGFALDGNIVKNFEDKHFTIMGYRTELLEDYKDKNNKIEKLILSVKLADGTIVDYFPNNSSQKVIIAKRGYSYDNWVNFVGEFETRTQRIGDVDKEVIYIKK